MSKIAKITKVDKLIEVLRDGHWHSGDELAAKVGFRFGDTIFKARNKGYSIERRQVGGSQHEYRLVTS